MEADFFSKAKEGMVDEQKSRKLTGYSFKPTKKTLKTSVAVAFKSTGSVCRQFAGKTFFCAAARACQFQRRRGKRKSCFGGRSGSS